MKWLRELFLKRPPWDDPDVERRLRPVRFRIAEERDFPFCESLHVANEAHGIPSDHRPVYREALRSGEMLTLVVENAGNPVATCGIQQQEEGLTWLCYGLVHPTWHRSGIGTTMFIARLALLPIIQSDQKVVIAAVENSLPYYRRFGFRFVGRQDFPDGNRFPIAVLDGITSSAIESCRAMLARAAVVLPDVSIAPLRKEADSSPLPGVV